MRSGNGGAILELFACNILIFNNMEKENTSADYQLPPLDLLDDYIPESRVPEEKIANGRRAEVEI